MLILDNEVTVATPTDIPEGLDVDSVKIIIQSDLSGKEWSVINSTIEFSKASKATSLGNFAMRGSNIYINTSNAITVSKCVDVDNITLHLQGKYASGENLTVIDFVNSTCSSTHLLSNIALVYEASESLCADISTQGSLIVIFTSCIDNVDDDGDTNNNNNKRPETNILLIGVIVTVCVVVVAVILVISTVPSVRKIIFPNRTKINYDGMDNEP